VRGFDGKEPPLGCGPAGGGKAAEPAARRDYAMTRHDDGERIASQRLSDLARRSRIAKPRRYVPLGERFTHRNGARRQVNASIELRHASHIEGNCRKIARFAAQECDNAVDCGLHRGWGCYFFGFGGMPKEAGARFGFGRFRQLHGDNATGIPGNTAPPESGSEKGKTG
jgi:hypothetical protein